jgi:hypothetical protein
MTTLEHLGERARLDASFQTEGTGSASYPDAGLLPRHPADLGSSGNQIVDVIEMATLADHVDLEHRSGTSPPRHGTA